MVDGVISQDSDCFAYGARRVYRNFSVSSQGAAAAQGGAVDVYDIDNVQKSMGKTAVSITVYNWNEICVLRQTLEGTKW